jgi:hypothetical protein
MITQGSFVWAVSVWPGLLNALLEAKMSTTVLIVDDSAEIR